MIAEALPPHQQQQQQQGNNFSVTNTKYYQFSTILEHVIDCFHTIVYDETNPYHPPLGWLTRRQPKPPDDELFFDLIDDCLKKNNNNNSQVPSNDNIQLSSSVRTRLERCPQQLRKEIVARQQEGCSPLFLACRNGLICVIKYLLDVCDADIEQRGRFEAFKDHHVHSVTPLWVAAVSGQLDTVRLLIERGANVNSLSDTGSTPLRSVCFLCKDEDSSQEYDNEHDDTFSFGGPNDEDADRDDIYMKIVYLLVEHSADISKPNYSGGTCLINSLHNYRLTNYIIYHGADVNATDNQSKTALHYAIQQDRLKVVKLLLASGANPYMLTPANDDALQLSCIAGHVDIFQYLIENYTYSSQRLADAYKLLGSSILEIHYDLSQVRKYWTKSLEMLANISGESTFPTLHNNTTSQPSASNNYSTNSTRERKQQLIQVIVSDGSGSDDNLGQVAVREQHACDRRRLMAYGDTREFSSSRELNSLTVDDFRIQSLLISERVLGSNHRETIQRLLYRGTFYINSFCHDRCINLWIYAFKLRLESDSIFHFESIFAAQAITKLFLDLFSQRQHQQVKFDDVYFVLSLLVDRLRECQEHLKWRPRSCLHEDIFDLLVALVVSLLLVLRSVRRHGEEYKLAAILTSKLIILDPRTSNGSSLLHVCVAPNMFEGEMHRSLVLANTGGQLPHERRPPLDAGTSNENDNTDSYSPVVDLVDTLVQAGLDVDLVNNDALSALQILCLATSIRSKVKRKLIELLVRSGAHVDRRAPSPEQEEQIGQALREANVKLAELVTLKCLAARKVSESRRAARQVRRLALEEDNNTLKGLNLTKNLDELIAIH